MALFENNDDKSIRIKPVFTVGTESGNAINVSVQLIDRENGNPLTERVGIQWYLAADANGDTIATAPSSGIAIGTNGLLIEHTNNIAGLAITEATGIFDVTISEISAKSFYLIVVTPDGKLYSQTVTFA